MRLSLPLKSLQLPLPSGPAVISHQLMEQQATAAEWFVEKCGYMCYVPVGTGGAQHVQGNSS